MLATFARYTVSSARWHNGSAVVRWKMRGYIDTPHGLKPDGFSVPRRGQRHASPKALPKPLYVPCRVVVSMQAHSAVWTATPADRQAFGDQHATARTSLAGERRIHCYYSPTGACCLEGEDDEERAPSGVSNRLGQMVILYHVGGL